MRPLVIALAGLLLVAGCTGGSDKPAVSSDRTSQPTPIVDARADDDVRQLIEGQDYSVIATLPAKIDGHDVYYSGMADDHTAFGELEPAKVGSGGVAILTDLQSGKPTYISTSHANSEAAGFVASAGWIVWLDSTPDYDEVVSWTLHSYERSTGITRQIAASPAREQGRRLGDLEPTISGSHAFLSAASLSTSDGDVTDSAYEVPLDGSARMKRVMANADLAHASDGILVYGHGSELIRRDLATGKDIVAGGCNPSAEDCRWGTGAGALAYEDGASGIGGGPHEGEGDSIHLVAADGTRSLIRLNISNTSGYALTGRWLTYEGDAQTEFMYDRRSHVVRTLPDATSWRGMTGVGDDLAWYDETAKRYVFAHFN